MITRTGVLASLVLTIVACGGTGSGSTTDGGGGDSGDSATIDAQLPQGCTAPLPGEPQCNNCIDDDQDGAIDGFDVQCTGPLDDDEGSFATGIPGDNVDAVKQDCFFDGNSGAGNDGCNIHVCCLLGATTVADCPIGANQYDPTACPPPIGTTPLAQQCIDACGALTPPGCDCFGCCSICDPVTNQCYDILTNPSASPDCTQDNLADPTKCMRCDKVDSCGPSECGGATCILCPGQDPGDLPPECNDTPMCPNGGQSCQTEACPAGAYCSTGCCIGVIQ